MALDANDSLLRYDAPEKDLYEIERSSDRLFYSSKMLAWTIRRERHGEPDQSFKIEIVDTPKLDSHDVLVLVMAAGVNYNGVWAGLGCSYKAHLMCHKADTILPVQTLLALFGP